MLRAALPPRLAAWLQRRWRPLILAAAALVGVLIGTSGLGVTAERLLQESRFALRQHAASGDLAIVEIDAHSVAQIDRWPWPRRNHAALIDRLHRAGAASITFDVDFSSRSSPADDAALAAALSRAGGQVVVPTFSQALGAGRRGETDALPAPALRAHAMLAAVTVVPDSVGVVRNAPFGTITAGLPRPSLSAMLAGRDGAAGMQFPIDYAIDPATIPRRSFIDVRDGRFVPALAAWAMMAVSLIALRLIEAIGRARAHDAQSGLPNRLALLAATRDGTDPLTIATARIADYDQIVATIGSEAVGDLMRRVRDRISALGGGVTVYRVEDRVLAWPATIAAEQLAARYEQLRAAMLAPVEVDARKVDVSLVVGMASAAARDAARVIGPAVLAAAQAQADGSG